MSFLLREYSERQTVDPISSYMDPPVKHGREKAPLLGSLLA
jgi:hypothetical protein